MHLNIYMIHTNEFMMSDNMQKDTGIFGVYIRN